MSRREGNRRGSRLTGRAGTGREKLLSFLPAAAWYAVIFAFSAQTGEESGRLSGAVVRGSFGRLGDWGALLETDWDLFLLVSFLVRKAAHMGIYFILTALLFYGLWKSGASTRSGGACALALCGILALLDEFHQSFVPGRDGKLSDALIDLCGGACFLLARLALSALWRRRKKRLAAVE